MAGKLPPFDTRWQKVALSLPPVSATTTRFESVIRAKLIANKVAGKTPDSIRGLARAMANGDDGRAENYKRSLFKWMAADGARPSPASRALVAHALGVGADELAEDDEESDPVATLMTALLEVARTAARAEIAAQTQEASA
jgi:hypothetical protein